MEYCCYCGRIIVAPLVRTTEHLVPKSKGGANSVANKKPCCNKCNTWRGNESLETFQKKAKNLLERKNFIKGYNKQDYETIIENISYWSYYISTAGDKLLVKKRSSTSVSGYGSWLNSKCVYCGAIGRTNKDHLYPKSKGGRVIVKSCLRCNRIKKDKTPFEWIRYVAGNTREFSYETGLRIAFNTIHLISNH